MTPAAPVSTGRSRPGSRTPSWVRLGAALGGGRGHRALLPAGRARPGRAGRARCRCCGRGATRVPRTPRSYGFAFGVALLRRGDPVDPLLRRTSPSSRWSSSMALRHRGRRARWSPRTRGAAIGVAVPHRRGVGGARGAARPLAVRRVPVGRPRRRAARRPAGTGARRASAARLLVSFVVVAVNGLLLDLGLALRGRTRRGARCWPASGVAGDPAWPPWSSTSPASSPPPPATSGSRCSRATTSSSRSPSR